MLLIEEFKDEQLVLRWLNTEWIESKHSLVFEILSARISDMPEKRFIQRGGRRAQDYILVLLENLNKFDKQSQTVRARYFGFKVGER